MQSCNKIQRSIEKWWNKKWRWDGCYYRINTSQESMRNGSGSTFTVYVDSILQISILMLWYINVYMGNTFFIFNLANDETNDVTNDASDAAEL